MKNKHWSISLAFFISFCIVSCSEISQKKQQDSIGESKQYPVTIDYASGVIIDTVLGGYQQISIIDISSNTVVDQYVLVPKGQSYQTKNNEKIIQIPVSNLGLLSTSYIGYLEELKALDKVVVIENSNYVYNEFILDNVAKGIISEVRNGGVLNLEKLIISQPQVLFTSISSEGGFNNELRKAKDAGIAVFQCSEWQENHPLARAEWIKVFGALLDKEEAAALIFEEIEKNYNQTKTICSSSQKTPKVLFTSMYQDVWFQPGGKSYVAQLIKDAQGTYPWIQSEAVGSLSLSMENVALEATNHDVWINPEVSSLAGLIAKDARYAVFLKENTMGVFQQNARMNKRGGNDCWEQGVIRPDLVLVDFAKILHPELFEDQSFTFFTKLK